MTNSEELFFLAAATFKASNLLTVECNYVNVKKGS